jgi:LemA protein
VSSEPSTISATPSRSRGLLFGVGLVAIIVVIGLWFMSVNNRLVSLQENVRTAWAQVETVLQRRFDLIPNLVNTVKGYAEHEASVLEEVTRLRSQWGAAPSVDEKAKIATQLEGTLSRLLLVTENYPALKADQNFRDLQFELAGTENRVAVERQRYNEVVRDYNTSVRQFPASIVASMRGFKTDFTYFEGAKEAQTAPKVDFSKPAQAEKPAAK